MNDILETQNSPVSTVDVEDETLYRKIMDEKLVIILSDHSAERLPNLLVTKIKDPESRIQNVSVSGMFTEWNYRVDSKTTYSATLGQGQAIEFVKEI